MPRSSRAIVLVFGEDANDTKAIAILIGALCPRLAGRVAVRREPLLLAKGMSVDQVAKRAEKAARALRAERARGRTHCVFLHEDADATEPAHEKISATKESALRRLGHEVHAVTPAWEIEAWWLMWPDAVASLRMSWQNPNAYVGKRVGLITNAKEELRRLLKPAGARVNFRNYEELDSPDIARIISEKGLARSPQGQSNSYDRFRQSVEHCCQQIKKS